MHRGDAGFAWQLGRRGNSDGAHVVIRNVLWRDGLDWSLRAGDGREHQSERREFVHRGVLSVRVAPFQQRDEEWVTDLRDAVAGEVLRGVCFTPRTTVCTAFVGLAAKGVLADVRRATEWMHRHRVSP